MLVTSNSSYCLVARSIVSSPRCSSLGDCIDDEACLYPHERKPEQSFFRVYLYDKPVVLYVGSPALLLHDGPFQLSVIFFPSCAFN